MRKGHSVQLAPLPLVWILAVLINEPVNRIGQATAYDVIAGFFLGRIHIVPPRMLRIGQQISHHGHVTVCIKLILAGQPPNWVRVLFSKFIPERIP